MLERYHMAVCIYTMEYNGLLLVSSLDLVKFVLGLVINFESYILILIATEALRSMGRQKLLVCDK